VGYTAFAFLETIKGWVGLGAATGKKLDTSKGGDQTKKPEPQPPIELSTGFGMSLAVSSDGKYAVVSGTPNAKKNTAEIWNLQTKAQMHEFQGAVSLPVIAPDGKFVVFADARGAATKIDIESGKETHLDINPIPVPDRFSFVRCSPTGEVYLFANRKAITWDANGKHRVVWTFADDFGSITPFFDGGKKIAIGDHRGAVSIWEIGQPKPVKTMKHKGNNSIFCLASADGNSIAAVTMGRQLINWDLRSDEKQELKLSETVPLRSAGPGQILALTPDGKTLIYPTLKNNIVLVNVDSGQPAHELKGHTKEISALTITADGSTLVSLDRDNALKIWDIKDLK
jgi:WD40 repeat protein